MLALYPLAGLLDPLLVSAVPGWAPWNVRAGIGLALVMAWGPRRLPLVMAAAVAGLALRAVLVPASHPLAASMAIPSLAEPLVFALPALLLARRLRQDGEGFVLEDVDGVMRLAGLTMAGALGQSLLLLALAWVLPAWPLAGWTLTGWDGRAMTADPLTVALQHWVGDVAGVTVVAPLALMVPRLTRHLHPARLLRAQILGQVAGICLSVAVIFPRVVGSRFYPVFIPLVWVAAGSGLPGAVLALAGLEAALSLGIAVCDIQPYQALKLQILMLSLAMTGLLLGAVISERERVRAAAAKGEARLKTLIELAPDGIVILDADGRVEEVNRLVADLTGRTPDSLRGRPLADLLHRESGEEWLVAADGRPLPVESSLAMVEETGGVMGVLTIRDISARKRAAAALGQHRAAAEQASRSHLTEELAAALAHELNQPLSAIVSYTGACRRILESESQSKALELMGKAAAQAERAGAIIRHLREFYRTGQVDSAPVPAGDLVAGVARLLADEVANAGARLDVVVGDGLILSIDRVQVEQVLINLVRNALDALADGATTDRRILIDMRAAEDGAAPPTRADIRVADTGPGIAEEVAGRLFAPFTTTRPTGMGLGLSISRGIVEAHGGRLRAGTGTLGGAAFSFSLPLVLPAEEAPTQEAPNAAA
ncbi:MULTISPECIES: ATP-binding protein [Nitrospirillum]|uniref:histidine kinase n=1 Tax=Nitrospirillum amazonense TaxID=28077 RepID=A0A560FAA7_9PROT|nr:ATP-binding protein [Nitrospirillum amazonense]MEC4592978.1 ATP-binding protein [Nitrospirillum amazonense]TWB18549.1 PAS domain S-box-containing protein [Nitrospirillum amazonense]